MVRSADRRERDLDVHDNDHPVGYGFVGTNASNGNGFTGTFVDDSKINGKWHGPGGAGWLTVYASPNGHSFNGSWGYNGRKENGTFVANKVLPPSPVTAAGKWNVTAAGGPKRDGRQNVVHAVRPIHRLPSRSGRDRRQVQNVRQGAGDVEYGGKSGWFSFWFNDDNNSFNGIWGYGADTTAPVGRVIGQRSLGN